MKHLQRYPASCFTLYYTKTNVIEPVTGVIGFLNDPTLIAFSMVPNLSRINTQDQERLPWFSSFPKYPWIIANLFHEVHYTSPNPTDPAMWGHFFGAFGWSITLEEWIQWSWNMTPTPKECIITREILENYHRFLLFDFCGKWGMALVRWNLEHETLKTKRMLLRCRWFLRGWSETS